MNVPAPAATIGASSAATAPSGVDLSGGRDPLPSVCAGVIEACAMVAGTKGGRRNDPLAYFPKAALERVMAGRAELGGVRDGPLWECLAAFGAVGQGRVRGMRMFNAMERGATPAWTGLLASLQQAGVAAEAPRTGEAGWIDPLDVGRGAGRTVAWLHDRGRQGEAGSVMDCVMKGLPAQDRMRCFAGALGVEGAGVAVTLGCMACSCFWEQAFDGDGARPSPEAMAWLAAGGSLALNGLERETMENIEFWSAGASEAASEILAKVAIGLDAGEISRFRLASGEVEAAVRAFNARAGTADPERAVSDKVRAFFLDLGLAIADALAMNQAARRLREGGTRSEERPGRRLV